MSYTYRRPHAYAAHNAARIEWQLQPSWTIDETTASLTLTTPAWTVGLFPSVNMTVVTLTLTTPRWNLGDTEIDITGASLELDTYRWTVNAETGWEIDGQALILTTPAWTVNPDLVPYLIGYSVEEAIAIARSYGLPPTLQYVKSGNAPVGTVTAQNPAPGQPIADFTSITLTVESGEYVWPSTIIPTKADWRLMTNTAMMISPLDGTTRTVGYGGDYWAVSLVVSNLTGGSTAALQAFLTRLRGRTHLTLLPDQVYQRRGTTDRNLYVDGDGQTGRTLECYGGPLTVVADAVRAGDLFSLEDRLYVATEDADIDGEGKLTLSMSPPLDGSPIDGALINLLNPYGRFRLTDNIVRWSHAPGGFTSFNSLEFAEVRVPLYDTTFTVDEYIRTEKNEVITDESSVALLT